MELLFLGCNAKSIGDTKRNEGETGRKIVKNCFNVSLPLIGELLWDVVMLYFQH